MNEKVLAVYSPGIGVVSETFIRRHMVDLHSGATVGVCDTMARPMAGHWMPEIPIHCTGDRWNYWRNRIADRFMPASMSWALHSTARFLRRHRVSVFMGEYLDASLPYLELCNTMDIRFFVHAHGQDVASRLRDPRYRSDYLRYARAEGIISMSRRGKEILTGLGLPGERIHVVPYGVNVPASLPAKESREEIHCLAVGRMTAIKAPILLLDAFRRACAANKNLRLKYIGGGELCAAARHYVECSGLESRVELAGAQPHEVVRDAMEKADIFLQHSATDPATGETEGLPVAILEAMAHGLPVISTRHAGIPEEVEEEVGGILVDEGDTVAMGDAIAALAANGKRRLEMGHSAHQRALSKFTWEREKAELRRILNLGSRQ